MLFGEDITQPTEHFKLFTGPDIEVLETPEFLKILNEYERKAQRIYGVGNKKN